MPGILTGDALIASLRSRHPDYGGDLGVDWWALVRDAYQGTGGFRASVTAARAGTWGEGSYESGSRIQRPSYLVRYPRESDRDFLRRIDASTYYNYVAPTVDTYAAYLLRRTAQRTTTYAPLAAFWQSADGRDHDVDEWLRRGIQHAQLFGWSGAVIDRRSGTFTRTDPKARPVARWLHPEEVADWQIGDDGTFDWIRLVSIASDRSPLSDISVTREVHTIWTRHDWTVVEIVTEGAQTTTTTESGGHTLGRVPVAVLYWQRGVTPGRLYGVSQVDGVVAANLDLFNVTSELREHIRSQVFGILCVQDDDPDVLRNLKLGTNNGLRVAPDMAFPQFVAPPQSIALTLEMRAAGIVAEIYRSAKLEQPKALSAGEASDTRSGVARAYDFTQTNRALCDFARHLTAFEWEVAGLVAAWEGETVARVQSVSTIAWPEDYDVTGLMEELSTQFAVLDRRADLPPIVLRNARLRASRALNPQASREDEAAILAQIDRVYRDALALFEKGESGKPAEIPFDVIKGAITLNEARGWLGLPARPDGDAMLTQVMAPVTPTLDAEAATAEMDAAVASLEPVTGAPAALAAP